MNIYKYASIEFATTDREKFSSTSPQDVELSTSHFLDAGPFALLKENKMGMLPELVIMIEEQQLLRLKEKDDKISDLKNQMDQMEFLLMNNDFSPLSKEPLVIPEQLAKLEQNFPNPFDLSSSIGCFIPSSAINASIEILSNDGRILSLIPLSERGCLKVEIDTTELASGNYSYQLVSDGKILIRKEMTILK